MEIISRDDLWKGIIKSLFPHFLHFFFSDYVHQIDFTRGVVFLDKELQKLIPKSKSKNRTADLLVQLSLLSGRKEWVYIHVEVQGYRDDDFAKRVFQMYSRIKDRFDRPVSILVIYSDGIKNFHPKIYQEEFFGTVHRLEFNTFKVLENPPSGFKNPNNPFAIIMEIAYEAVKTKSLKEENYKVLLYKILKKLVKSSLSHKMKKSTVNFLRYYFSFENPTEFSKFNDEIDEFLKIEDFMDINELVRKHQIEEGIRIGISRGEKRGEKRGKEIGEKRGEKRGKEIGIDQSAEIIRLKKSGKSAEEIAQTFDLSLDTVLKIYNLV